MSKIWIALAALPLMLCGCLSSFDKPYEDRYGPFGNDDDDNSGDDDDATGDDDDAVDDDTADDDDDDTTPMGPRISISPIPVSIDPAYVDIPAYGTFTITNTGDQPLIVTNMVLANNGGGVLSLAPWTGNIQPGDDQLLSTNLAASCFVSGQVVGGMTISSNDSGNPDAATSILVNCI
jgi:hypothetical protein